ncbi:BZ3500_MvSof-1268-A1-R1_Chr11-3g03591 [Microbotryum saponariae]|uniref:BZ3500_MvSof-1268-A1-R1_Chr11-3g03591 protein n=1 Tax=Microbotryum saponariae TaxID=289078 RepID=A0A2X0LET5_9BASI|nr:BZ3500_MvSof-1268-A1-R1_Chr11-3g03591 [Microbotryum saponariae]SDA03600.1 BZ3501_MvSof-1269-A2-R1_Chr11g03168 [Microbotryum saponariae]
MYIPASMADSTCSSRCALQKQDTRRVVPGVAIRILTTSTCQVQTRDLKSFVSSIPAVRALKSS